MSGRRKKILFDQTQNERGRLDSTYSELGQVLKDNDFDVEAYTEFMILGKHLKDTSVMVFGCPNSSKLRPAEIDVLNKFVTNGGGLLLLSLSGGDRGLMNNMSKISSEFGITFENTAVKDDRNNAGLPTMPIVSDIVMHPSTEDVKDLLIPSACSLKVTGKATSIANTSDTADPGRASVIAIAEAGKGRIMCIGSYEVFRQGGGLKHKGNVTFALKAFRWLSGEIQLKKPSTVAEVREEVAKQEKSVPAESKELEQTLKRLVNAVFDLQKDISKVKDQVSNVDNNVEMLRDQFQDFAEKTQQQLGVMIPASQFKTQDETKTSSIEGDIKALKKELKSVEQLRKHIEKRHTSGAMPEETFSEQVAKLDARIKSLKKKMDKKQKELDELKQPG